MTPENAEILKRLKSIENRLEKIENISNSILKIKDFNTSKNGITVSCTNGKIKISGTATASTTIFIKDYLNLDYINRFIGKTVTFSIAERITPLDYKFSIQFVTSNNGYYMQLQNRPSVTRVLDAELLNFTIVVSNGNTVDVEFHLQLEEGSEATEYEPYGAMPSPERPSEIRNVGDNRNINIKISDNLTQEQTISFPLKKGQVLHKGDYLADDGVHNNWEKRIFNGTEAWKTSGSAPNQNETKRFALDYDSELTNNTLNPMCENLKVDTPSHIWTVDAEAIGQSSGDIVMRLKKSRASTVEELKSYLAENPITIYLERKETVEPYSPEQQQAYNELMSMTSYENTTHIFSEDEISPIFNIIAYAKGTNTVQKQPSQITNEPNMSEPQNDNPSMEEDTEAGEVEE